MSQLTEREIETLLRGEHRAPAPPADLLARIKAEIPAAIAAPAARPSTPAGGRGRPSRWLLAASLASAVGGGWLAVLVLRQPAAHDLASAPAISAAGAEATRGAETENAAADRHPEPAELSEQLSIEAPAAPEQTARTAPAAPPAAPPAAARRQLEAAREAQRADDAASPEPAEDIATAADPEPAAAPAAARPERAVEEERARQREPARQERLRKSMARIAADQAPVAAGREAGALARIRRALRAGSWPAPEAVDAAELIDAFGAGEPTAATGDGMTLRVAGGPALFADPSARLLRVDLRLAGSAAAAGPALLEVAFDPRTVARAHRVGGAPAPFADGQLRAERRAVETLEVSDRRTVLYRLTVRAGRPPAGDDTVATLRVRFSPFAGGEPVERTRTVTAAELAASWPAASPALRQSAVVAAWAMALEAGPAAPGGELDALLPLARQLAAERGDDHRYWELIELIECSAALRDR